MLSLAGYPAIEVTPETPLGYVFIYFYGLSKGALLLIQLKQAVDDAEFKSLFDEILRLKGIYGSSRSFSNYATRLLEIMCSTTPSRSITPGT